MRLSKYNYNPKTCRYEPTRTSVSSLAGYVILFSISTLLIFTGILFLHSKLFLTEKGKAQKKENVTLTKHHTSLLNGLSSVEGVLTNLNDQNSNLHKQIFETPIVTVATLTTGKESVLLADASGFKAVANALKIQSSSIAKASSVHNTRFGTVEIRDKELQFLMTVPSIQPIENAALTKLVSGFGKRINPFHKGNYHHPGADFAATRGTPVLATAKGIVVDLKNGSSLQAGYGNHIEIDHGNGLITRYAHLEDVLVRVGQKVSKNSVIGTVGMSGGATAPHVHYEIIRNGEQVDPVPYMLEKLNSKEYIELQNLGSKKNQSLD